MEPQMSADFSQINADVSEIFVDRGSAPSDFPQKELTRKIIGAAFEVHKELGPGFLEKVYETALLFELDRVGARAISQAPIPVLYKEQPVGLYFADILVENAVICEIKAIDALTPVHEAQVLHYLKATKISLGLLLNFGTSKVQVKRFIRSK